MKDNTEKLILDTARKHFVANGYAATRMQDIADEANINKAMLHYYFRSKEKLYRKILTQTLDDVIPKFAAAMGVETSFWERVEHVVDTYLSVLRAQPDIPVFIMSELSQKRESFLEELRKRAHHFPAVQSMVAAVIVEQQAGRIRPIPPAHLMLNLMGMMAFPFIAKPIFCTIMDFSEEQFDSLMAQRKAVIMDFLRRALTP